MTQLQKETMVENSSRLGFHYGYIILIIGILTVTGALGFARFGYATIVPSMKVSLLLNNTQMGAIATGNLIGYTAFSLIGGFLAARYGPRLIIGFSMSLTGVTMFLTGLSGGFASAVALRFLTGFGSAGSNVPMMGLASAWFGPKRRGMAAGFLVGGSGLGFFVTGFLVPKVIAASPQNGWRLSWFILGALVVLLGLLSYIFLRNSPKDKGLLPLGVESVASPQSSASSMVDQMGEVNKAAPVSGPEATTKSIVWSSVYASPAMWHLGFIYLFFGFEYIIYGTFFSTALVSDKGFTQAQAGAMWALAGAIGIFSGILWGAVSDYIGRKYALAIVFALHAVCYYLFYSANADGGMLLVSVILYGLTAFSIPGIVAATCGDYVGARLAPAALGMVTLFFAIGQAAAPSVAGYLADATCSFNKAFLLAAAVAAVGSVGSLTLGQPKHKL
ncbi:MFS transporter [Desulfoscipio gibsoniae]|uniref:Sugar phosphate permease n=1 Tax=Desulfoscipio gibsoniae DSM 7213 TaxID=767817 RepID=R4KCL5_9FIRM|nr:MFS transporter [Desulfoscipio gibsoniae]AGL00923.1 sugar phosphate permease [Desulfoscipio gibsoniae DSM 7213]